MSWEADERDRVEEAMLFISSNGRRLQGCSWKHMTAEGQPTQGDVLSTCIDRTRKLDIKIVCTENLAWEWWQCFKKNEPGWAQVLDQDVQLLWFMEGTRGKLDFVEVYLTQGIGLINKFLRDGTPDWSEISGYKTPQNQYFISTKGKGVTVGEWVLWSTLLDNKLAVKEWPP